MATLEQLNTARQRAFDAARTMDLLEFASELRQSNSCQISIMNGALTFRNRTGDREQQFRGDAVKRIVALIAAEAEAAAGEPIQPSMSLIERQITMDDESITCAFDTRCISCGEVISAGSPGMFVRNQGIRHVGCP